MPSFIHIISLDRAVFFPAITKGEDRTWLPSEKDRQTDRSDLSWLSIDIVWKMTGRKTRYDCLNQSLLISDRILAKAPKDWSSHQITTIHYPTIIVHVPRNRNKFTILWGNFFQPFSHTRLVPSITILTRKRKKTSKEILFKSQKLQDLVLLVFLTLKPRWSY